MWNVLETTRMATTNEKKVARSAPLKKTRHKQAVRSGGTMVYDRIKIGHALATGLNEGGGAMVLVYIFFKVKFV